MERIKGVSYIDLDALKFNFHLSTIAYRKNKKEYSGLLKFSTQKKKDAGQMKINCVLKPDNSTTRRVQFNRIIMANNALGYFVTPYDYDPATFKETPEKGLVFRPEDVPEEFMDCAIRSFNSRIGDDELDKIRSLSYDMRDLVLEKAMEGWGEYANPNGRNKYKRMSNHNDFTIRVFRYIDREFDECWKVVESFTGKPGNRDISNLPKDKLYRIDGYMKIEVSPDEWQPLLK